MSHQGITRRHQQRLRATLMVAGIIVTIVATFGLSRPALAAEQLDQQQLVATTFIADRSGLGQSFTAGPSGRLSRIELYACRSTSETTATLAVYPGVVTLVSSPLPPPLIQQTFSLADWPTGCSDPVAWVSIPLTSPLSVTTGEQYTFQIFGGPHLVLAYNQTNPYAGGNSLSSFGADYVFKTYVDAPDTTAPNTTIGTKPANRTNQMSATFGFSSDEAGSTFECKLDGGSFAACTSPHTYNSVADGSHTFQVRATDAAGNVDPTPASYTWTVDTTPPAVSVTVTVPSGATCTTPVTACTINATSAAGTPLSFVATATDTTPANPMVTCTPASGSTFAITTTTVSCSATDATGNTGSKSFTVTVKGAATQVTDLQSKVQALSLDPPAMNSVTSLLQNAQTAIGRGDIAGGCDKLSSFISQVKALSGKKIIKSTADGLIADAQRIKSVLGCR